MSRLLSLAALVRATTEGGAAEAMRLAADLARALDALLIEEVEPARLAEAVADAPELAAHWQLSLDRLRAILDQWPAALAAKGRIDLATAAIALLRATAERWAAAAADGFTIAAGITTAAPAVAALLARVARMPGGAVVLPALSLSRTMPDDEWDALGPDEQGRAEETHPQYHLKLLLDRMGVARGEVDRVASGGRGASPAVRGRAIAHAMTAADFSDKWNALPPRERRLTGIRAAELADPAAEAQTIAIALREAVETPGRTAALVTPDRMLASRVSALARAVGDRRRRQRRAALVANRGGNVAARHRRRVRRRTRAGRLARPAQASVGRGRRRSARLARSGARARSGAARPAPAAPDSEALDAHFAEKHAPSLGRWSAPGSSSLGQILAKPTSLDRLAAALREAASALAGDAAWRGADGRMAAELLAELEAAPDAPGLTLDPEDAGPMLRQLLDERPVRPPYGGHPRIFIWGLLEARLQQADLMILGGMNEGVWPSLPAPDPWLAPKIRANLGLAGSGVPHRPCRARLRQRAGRAARARHPRPPRRQGADRRLALLAAAAGDDRRAGARPPPRTPRRGDRRSGRA